VDVPKVYFDSLKHSCPVGGAGPTMMGVMMGAGAKGLVHIGRDFSIRQQMLQGSWYLHLRKDRKKCQWNSLTMFPESKSNFHWF
jgi:hypothetical protein